MSVQLPPRQAQRKTPIPDAPLSPTPHVDKDQAKAVADAPAAPELVSGHRLSSPTGRGGEVADGFRLAVLRPRRWFFAVAVRWPRRSRRWQCPGLSCCDPRRLVPGSRRGPEVIVLAKDPVGLDR